MSSLKLSIRVFKATDDLLSCDNYVDQHLRVLSSYGITKLSSINTQWKYDPNCYIILFESENKTKIYGGGRIQIKSENINLPIEEAISIVDKNIYSYVKEIGNYKIAEFCGLWNSREVAGYGIGSIILGRIGVAISTQLQLQYLIALCSPATLLNCTRIGFEVITELGNNGTFYYPKEDLIATALVIKDINILDKADPNERKLIFDLREKPIQISLESGPKGSMLIDYNIKIN
ncbi:MAG: hypothetical protein EOP34_03640 [Rickettsiales bacterium]|nr:MAG: hypothetical protein EOP34_03640 [Rickettsiales bacterium]